MKELGEKGVWTGKDPLCQRWREGPLTLFWKYGFFGVFLCFGIREKDTVGRTGREESEMWERGEQGVKEAPGSPILGGPTGREGVQERYTAGGGKNTRRRGRGHTARGQGPE